MAFIDTNSIGNTDFIDDIVCPYCKEKIDGIEVIHGKSDVICPKCGKKINVFISGGYTAIIPGDD